ncbi:MAG: flotillin family protein [Deltaproteobacteria bacterium]|nr:flotillin family protein [Deltaproteobacteria bacterium]
MTSVVILAGVVFLGVVVVVLTIKRLLFICQPNEVLIFSGAKGVYGERKAGYRPVKGGRKIKLPMLEVVDRMDLTNMAIAVSVHGAFSKGGIPLNVDGVANVKIAGEEPLLGNAVERLLGKRREEIVAIAKETLEGNLRGVLATLTPEEVNADKIAFAQKLMEEADHDLNRLGMVLDTLKIQNVSDGVGYLDSIGRISSAEIRKHALIAEAESKALAEVKDAMNRQEAELVRIETAVRTLEAETRSKVADAQTQQAALIAEAQGKISAAVVQARAELEVQKARVEQVKQQLEADVVAPAQAQMQAATSEARGAAARIVEQGRATAEVLTQISRAWKLAGPNARDVFLMQKLEGMTEQLVATLDSVKVDKVTVLGTGAGGGGDWAPKVIGAAEQLKAALGVDLLGAVQQRLEAAPAATGGKRTTQELRPPTPPRG